MGGACWSKATGVGGWRLDGWLSGACWSGATGVGGSIGLAESSGKTVSKISLASR